MTETESVAFVLRLRPGCEAEYQRRHDAIWPELTDLFAASGILHYEIHLHAATGMLFAFQFRRLGHRVDAMRNDPIMTRWRDYMADVLVQDNGTPVREELAPMFKFESKLVSNLRTGRITRKRAGAIGSRPV